MIYPKKSNISNRKIGSKNPFLEKLFKQSVHSQIEENSIDYEQYSLINDILENRNFLDTMTLSEMSTFLPIKKLTDLNYKILYEKGWSIHTTNNGYMIIPRIIQQNCLDSIKDGDKQCEKIRKILKKFNYDTTPIKNLLIYLPISDSDYYFRSFLFKNLTDAGWKIYTSSEKNSCIIAPSVIEYIR